MLRTSIALAFLLMLPVSYSAQVDEDPAALFYRAFYQETALRDLEAARQLYAELVAAEADRVDSPLLARAYLGYARCAYALGETEEAKRLYQRALTLDPENEEAHRGATAPDAPPGADDLQAHIQKSISRLSGADREQATKDLLVYSTRAVPALAAGLRSPDAGIVDLCAGVLITLCRGRNEAAIREYAKALGDPEVKLRSPVVGKLAELDWFRPDTMVLWESVLSIPDDTLRQRALEAFVEDLRGMRLPLESDSPDGEPPALGLFREISEHGSPLLQGKLVQVVRSRELTIPHLEIVHDLVRRGLFHPNRDLRSRVRDYLRVDKYYPVHREQFLHEVLARGAELDEDDVRWVTSVLSQQHVPAADLVTLLDSSVDDVRRAAFWTLYARRSRDASLWPPEADAHVKRHLVEWIENEDVLGGPSPRTSYEAFFKGYDLPPDVLLALWRAYRGQKWSGSDARAARSSRNYILKRLVQAMPEEERVPALHNLVLGIEDAATRGGFLSDLAAIGMVPPIFRTLQVTAADPESTVRSATYKVLLHLQEAHPEAVRTIDVPQLSADALAGRWYGTELAVRTGRTDLVPLLRAGLAEVAAEDYAAVFAVLLVLEGIETHGGTIQARYGKESSAHTEETRIGAFKELFWALSGYLEQPHPAFVDLAALVADDAQLLYAIVDNLDLEVWAPAEGGRFLRQALERADELQDGQLEELLQDVSYNNLDVPVQMILPFLRSRSGEVRQAATQAFDAIQRFEQYRRAAASFGADAREHAIEMIQNNIMHGDPLQRRAAAHAIAALGDPDGVYLLLLLVKDEDEGVREAAVAALERMGSQGRIETPPPPPAEEDDE